MGDKRLKWSLDFMACKKTDISLLEHLRAEESFSAPVEFEDDEETLCLIHSQPVQGQS